MRAPAVALQAAALPDPMTLEGTFRPLLNRVAIVTGATSGLGWATCLALSAAGARIVATGRREERLQALKIEIERGGGSCLCVPGDAADCKTSTTAVSKALDVYQRLDILINSAGQGMYKSLQDTTTSDFDQLMSSNVRSTFLFTRAVAPVFVAQRAGVIIVISSVVGLSGAANEAVYSATKFAQVGFAQSMDEELRPFGVKVCVICPGGMKTEFAVGNGRVAEEVAASWMMEASQVADTVVFTCSQPANVRIPQMLVRHMGWPPS